MTSTCEKWRCLSTLWQKTEDNVWIIWESHWNTCNQKEFRVLKSLNWEKMVSFDNFVRIASLFVGFHLGTLHGGFTKAGVNQYNIVSATLLFSPTSSYVLATRVKLTMCCTNKIVKFDPSLWLLAPEFWPNLNLKFNYKLIIWSFNLTFQIIFRCHCNQIYSIIIPKHPFWRVCKLHRIWRVANLWEWLIMEGTLLGITGTFIVCK